jgi:hypothetical protein
MPLPTLYELQHPKPLTKNGGLYSVKSFISTIVEVPQISVSRNACSESYGKFV